MEKRMLHLALLKEQFPDEVMATETLPSAYCEQIENVKAIVLGCDPSNRHSHNLEYAFGIDSGIPKLNLFFSGIEANLKQIGLDRKCVYIQNLCQNYFTSETAGNSIWYQAAKVWRPFLKDELQALNIPKEVPVLLTAQEIYFALLNDGIKKQKAKDLYLTPNLTPIPPKDNFLERPLIPLYRGGKGYYNLDKWKDYQKHISNIIVFTFKTQSL
jgi:hypothetical protein